MVKKIPLLFPNNNNNRMKKKAINWINFLNSLEFMVVVWNISVNDFLLNFIFEKTFFEWWISIGWMWKKNTALISVTGNSCFGHIIHPTNNLFAIVTFSVFFTEKKTNIQWTIIIWKKKHCYNIFEHGNKKQTNFFIFESIWK